MILHAYCIRAAGEPPPGPEVRGIGGAEVVLVDEAGMSAWVSRLDAPPAPEPGRLREHDAVVRAALRTATPLPLRFGTAFADEGALRAVLGERAAELLASLERVRGRVEMGAVLGRDAAAARERMLARRPELRPMQEKPATGRAYLEARRREHGLEAALREEAEALLERVSRAVAAAVPEAVEARTTLPKPEVAGALAHLVRRGDVSAYREAVKRVAEELPEAEVRVSGPWAPYSFV
ncbi:MAG TPA: GvpL/GvpF family gas vesicle protein [Longimicrobiaceae bacterium]|nr:GvpL/GvpF family gas vesicle protein [Longimicrobiaceae bacterium]